MGFSVNTNIDALNTYRNLNTVQNSLSNSLAKLSSGLRINNAGDDAAGLTIATSLGAQVSGLTQAARNAQDGTSVVQTADGALGQAQSLLQRLRDLAVQAGNDSNSPAARTAITTEATSITAELGRLGSSVNFNGINLLDGTAGTNGVLKFQIGANSSASNDQIQIDLTGADLTKVAGQLGTGAKGALFTGPSGVNSVPGLAAGLNDATAHHITFSSQVGTGGNTTVNTFTLSTNLTTSNGATVTDAASIAAALNANSDFSAKFNAVVQYTTAADGTASVSGLGIVAKDGGSVSIHDDNTVAVNYASGATTALTALNLANSDGARQAIATIDAQLAKVSTARANIGAAENRFASAVSTINTSITNLTAAKSRITDVDMAQEMVSYSRANILSQSGTAMLAQANALPQLALKLLQG